jgi:hypothetical protein
MRRRGPLGISRIPVASTTIAPGFPRANRSYHRKLDSVTNPSSVARQGTMAGTHVRSRSTMGPIRTGRNQSASEASCAPLATGVRQRVADSFRRRPHAMGALRHSRRSPQPSRARRLFGPSRAHDGSSHRGMLQGPGDREGGRRDCAIRAAAIRSRSASARFREIRLPGIPPPSVCAIGVRKRFDAFARHCAAQQARFQESTR